jgi:hypothetical protein
MLADLQVPNSCRHVLLCGSPELGQDSDGWSIIIDSIRCKNPIRACLRSQQSIPTAADTRSTLSEEEHVGRQTGYAPVNGLQMYYGLHGIGDRVIPPLVLLHGGGDTIQTSFDHVLTELSRDRQVIAFDQQGYGHTADIPDRPFL